LRRFIKDGMRRAMDAFKTTPDGAKAMNMIARAMAEPGDPLPTYGSDPGVM